MTNAKTEYFFILTDIAGNYRRFSLRYDDYNDSHGENIFQIFCNILDERVS